MAALPICAVNGGQYHDDPEFHKKAMHEEYYTLYRKWVYDADILCANYLTIVLYAFPSDNHCTWFEKLPETSIATLL
jgi:hypothetical protein